MPMDGPCLSFTISSQENIEIVDDFENLLFLVLHTLYSPPVKCASIGFLLVLYIQISVSKLHYFIAGEH